MGRAGTSLQEPGKGTEGGTRVPGHPCVKAETPPAQGGCSRVLGGLGYGGCPWVTLGGSVGRWQPPGRAFPGSPPRGPAPCVGLGANKGPSWLLPGLCERPFKFQTSSRAK